MIKRLADEQCAAKMGVRVTAATDETSPLMVKRLGDEHKPAKLGVTALPAEEH